MKEKKNSKGKAKEKKAGMFASPGTVIGIAAVILLAVALIWAANPYKEKTVDDKVPTINTPQTAKKIANSQPTAAASNVIIVVNRSMEPSPTPAPTPEIIISQGEAVSRKDLTVIAIEAPDKVSVGDTITVNITVTPMGRIGGIEMAVIFGNNLQAENVILGDALSPDFSSGGTIKNSEGTVSDIIAQPVDLNGGFPAQKFTLATITFIAITKGEATIAIKKFSAVDLDSNLIPVAIVNKKVTIG